MERGLDKLLSKKDLLDFCDFIQLCLTCHDEEKFKLLISLLKNLLPFDFSTTGLACINNSGIDKQFVVINISYPLEWMDLYLIKKFNEVDPVVIRHFRNFELQNWSETFKQNPPPPEFLKLARDFGLEKGYTCGTTNLFRTEGSLFSISGPSLEKNKRTEFFFKAIVPHLHLALVNVLAQNKRKEIPSLSKREKEVLKWTAKGKSSWDISIILNISENTVNYHISKIKQKLDAVSRYHAVAIALELGLIGIQ